MPDLPGLPGLLRSRRDKRALGQLDLARHCGVTQQTVSRWEQGLGVPRPSRIPLLAEALGVDAQLLHHLSGYLPEPTGDAQTQLARAFDLGRLTDAELVELRERAEAELRHRQAASGTTA